MSKYITICLLFPLVFSCKPANNPLPDINRDFHLPVIVQSLSTDSTELRKMDFINEADFLYVGKHEFTDTLSWDHFLKEDDEPSADMIHERSRPEPRDTLSTDGFQIIPDYTTSVRYKREYQEYGSCYFPIYVVNETSSTKVFYGKDRRAFGIQEARYTSKSIYSEWRPIEARGFDFCGNGSFGIRVHPGEFVLLLAPKYQGEETNMMRVRLQIGESLYISQSYEGTYSNLQFKLHKSSNILRHLKNNEMGMSAVMFYGAMPIEADPK